MSKNASHRFATTVFSLIFLGFSSVTMAQEILYGSSTDGPADIYTIDTATGVVTLLGATGLSERVSGLAINPQTCNALGLFGGSAAGIAGAQLVEIDLANGAATQIGTLIGSGFDGSINVGGAGSLRFSAGLNLYSSGWSGGFSGGSFLRIDPLTGAVLQANATTGGALYTGLAFDSTGTLWASRGGNGPGQLHTVDPTNGAILTTLALSDGSARITDLAFSDDGTLYASMRDGNTSLSNLVTINTTSGGITTIGPMGVKIGGLVFTPLPCRTPNIPVPGLGQSGMSILIILLVLGGFLAFRVGRARV
ncbi:MAG: hypothetical protein BMS9Abin30_1103 [Gammaproteobacteria bacterium]|nr:MAG: hypothetical protein BMS9Abin30_1103 [Gammaproteobacteria bacterium]